MISGGVRPNLFAAFGTLSRATSRETEVTENQDQRVSLERDLVAAEGSVRVRAVKLSGL